MAKKTSVDQQNTINIKSVPMQLHINASKFFNDDWKTIAFSFQRTDLAGKFVDKELRYNSLYFLFGYDDDGREIVYVGQALKRADGESVLSRLREHDKSATERYRDKWMLVVVVTNEDDVWGSTELDALESIFINEIPDKNNLNGRRQNSAGAELSLYEDKVTQIKALITAIGYKIFENIPETESIQVTSVVNDHSAVKDLHSGMERIPEIVTPDRVVKKMVDMLPKEVWNSKTKFLDPACKGGEYLREIYDRLMETEVLQSEFPNTIERSNHILKDQIFGIALSKVSLDRTAKKLLGEDRNIRIIPNYINILKYLAKTNKELQEKITWQGILEKEFNREMKIDVVIGNPPYQETTGSGLNESGGKALFDSFIINGTLVTDRLLCMITPTKWISGTMKAFVDVRKALLSEKHLSNMVEFFNPTLVFPGTQIAGGVSYFIYDKKYTGKTDYVSILNGKEYNGLRDIDANDIIPRHFIGETVIDKVRLKNENQAYMSDFVKKDLWKLPTNFDDGSNVKDEMHSLEVITPRGSTYVEKELFNYTDAYKVIFTRVVNGSTYLTEGKKQILSSLNILEPDQICNASYMVIPNITTKEYAENIKAYMKTKFVRFLILQTLFGIGLTADRFKYVPVVDFTKYWTDKELYSYFGLDDREIEFIEDIIKSMGATDQQPKTKFTKQDAMAAYIHQQLSKH